MQPAHPASPPRPWTPDPIPQYVKEHPWRPSAGSLRKARPHWGAVLSTINQPPSTSTQYIYQPENGNNYFQLFFTACRRRRGGAFSASGFRVSGLPCFPRHPPPSIFTRLPFLASWRLNAPVFRPRPRPRPRLLPPPPGQSRRSFGEGGCAIRNDIFCFRFPSNHVSCSGKSIDRNDVARRSEDF